MTKRIPLFEQQKKEVEKGVFRGYTTTATQVAQLFANTTLFSDDSRKLTVYQTFHTLHCVFASLEIVVLL